MVELKPVSGVDPKTREPISPQTESTVEHIYDGASLIGMCQKRVGGSAVLFRPVSEATEFEIRRALDDRDGVSCPERLVKLSPDDPRNTCNVLTR